MKKSANLFCIFLLTLFFTELLSSQNDELKISYQCAPCGCPHDGQIFEVMGVCPSCNMPLRPSYPGIERPPTRPQMTVGILLFDGADIMDVTGPWSVFEHAGMNVVTVAKTTDMVQIGRAMNIKPDFQLENLPSVDVIVVPGGGPAEMNQDPAIVQWLKGRHTSTETMLSVCSGAFLFGLAGLLDGQEATTFASLIPSLTEQFPKAKVLNTVQYTDNGKVITSAGLSSGIEAAFHVIEKFYGQGRAQDVANHMEYDWAPAKGYARSQLADHYIGPIRNLIELFSTKYIYSNGDANKWEYQFLLSEKITAEKVISLLQKELNKNKSWKKTGASSNSLNGIITHETLGKAKIKISINQQPNGNVATVLAKVK